MDHDKPNKYARLRNHIQDVFFRVLDRDEKITLFNTVNGFSIQHKEQFNRYLLTVNVYPHTGTIFVHKSPLESDPDIEAHHIPLPFFHAQFQLGRLGRLKKTALILHKKISMASVYEVMRS